MHELLLLASLPPRTIPEALSVLQGYTHMSPIQIFRRKIDFRGPSDADTDAYAQSGTSASFSSKSFSSEEGAGESTNGGSMSGSQEAGVDGKGVDGNGKGVDGKGAGVDGKVKGLGFSKELLVPRSLAVGDRRRAEAWRELDAALGRIGYFLSGGWVVGVGERVWEKEGVQIAEYNSKPGTLRFVERPDAGFTKPIVSRGVIQIENEMNLISNLQRCNYTPFNAIFTETWHCYHNNIFFELMRILVHPETGKPEDLKDVAFRDQFTAFGGKWIFTVRVEVADGSQPKQMDHAKGMLLEAAKELGGYFDWESIEVGVLDPRVRFA